MKNSAKAIVVVAAAAFVTFAAIFGLLHSGKYLVVDHPSRSDVIVVLSGDHNDLRYWRGLQLLRDGYGQRMIVDASADRIFGRSYAEDAAAFVAKTAGNRAPQIGVCTIKNDSTVQEASDLRTCLANLQPPPRSVLLVTSDFHTRRALSIFRSRLSQYRWSAAATRDPSLFGEPWWSNREWAKTWAYEWEKLLWWTCFESWRS